MIGTQTRMPTKSQSLKKVKGLPKRASQPQHKTRRQACWARGEDRKAERRLLQGVRTRDNNILRMGRKAAFPGVPVHALSLDWLTPWEQSQLNRRRKRAKLQNKAVVVATPKAEES